MLRKLALFLLPLAIFAAACGSDEDTSPDGGDTPQPTATAAATEAATETASPPASEPTAIVINTPNLSGGYNDGGGSSSAGLFGALNPLELLNGIDAGTATDGVSPELAAMLLNEGDLPSGFVPMGDFSMSIPTSQYGTMDMSMNMFASGDIMTTGELGSMVISAAILVPPEARDEMGIGSLDDLQDLSDEDLDDILNGASMFGVSFNDLHVLDGSGLGDGGAGIHMEMDFSGMADAFGGGMTEGMPAGLAFDMYMFFEGDYMQMVMVMSPTGVSSGVDARHLADVLDART
jgi:hypothetical protein